MAHNLRNIFCASLIQHIKDIIYSKSFIDDNSNAPKDFTRTRKWPFPRLMLFLASPRNSSMQSELSEFLDALNQAPLKKTDDTSIFKARLKLAPSAFVDINRKSVEFFMREGDVKQWNGFQLIDVDGTTLRLPNTEDLNHYFHPNVDAEGNDVGPPLARMNLLYDPLNQLCLSAELDGTDVSEITQFTHQDWQWKSGQLFLGDRHYDAFWLFAWLREKGCDFCIRLKLDTRPVVKEFLQSGLEEKVVDFTPGRSAKTRCRKRNLPTQTIKLRLIRVELPGDRVEVLATSLLDVQKIPAEQFAELYHLRWPIEEKFKQLKFRVNLENWSGKSGLSVLQDVYSRLWSTNMMVLMAHPLDSQLDERSSRCQYDYQINWAHAIGCMKRAMVNLFFGSAVQENLERLWVRFLSALSPIRPNRKYVINHKTYKREFYMCYKFCC